MKLLLIVVFVLNSLNLYSENSTEDFDTQYYYLLQRGFDEINNNYQFRKALQILENKLPDKNLTPEKKNELLERKKVLQERIETFSIIKSNKFPIGPIISRSYENHHRYEPAYKLAIDGSLEEVKEILRQMSIREGQISVLFLRGESVSMAAEEVAFRKLEGFPYYNPLTRENLLDIFGKNISLKDIKDNPGLLKNYFLNEPWDVLVILNISNLLGTDDKNPEAFYAVDLYKYYSKEPDRLTQFATMTSSGVTTGSYYNIAMRDTLLIACVILIFIFISIAYIFKNNDSFEKTGIINIKNDIFSMEFFKGLGISTLFIVLGIVFCFGIGSGSEQILGSWNTHVGSLQFQSLAILTGIMTLINPVLLLILTKLTDYVSMVKNRFYLPILLSSFYSGIAIYMHYFYELYDSIFPGDNHILGIYLMSFGTIINGFITGEIYRELIDLNSKKAIYNIKIINEGGSVHQKTNPLVNKRFSIYFLLIFITSQISVSSLDTFFKASSSVSPILFILLIFVSLLLLLLKNKLQLSVDDSVYEFTKIQIEPPKNMENLKSLLLDPDKIPYTHEKNISTLLINNSINLCFEREGDAIALYGGKWSGKNRLIKEILKDPMYSGRTEFRVDCLHGGEKLLPFIEGMKSLPQIQSILENLKLGKGAQKAAGLLSNVFSFIPVAGGLISKFFEDENIDLTSKEKEKFLEKTLLETVHNLSKEIKELKTEEGKTRDQLIFIIDNFQSINDSMFELIEKIRERIKDNFLSPEKNKIAFILLVNTDYRTDLFERYEFSSLIPGDADFNFHLEGLSTEVAFHYFHNHLNFGKTRKNDDLLEKIIEIYGEKDINNNYKIFPKYITETLLHEITNISINYNQFIYTGNPLQISITPSIYHEYNKKLDLLRTIEIKILEAASIFGNTFNIHELSFILNIDVLVILDEMRLLEKEEEIILRISSNGDFKFRKGVYREAFRRKIVNRIFVDGKKEVPFQIFIEYCNRALNFYTGCSTLTLQQKERFANTSRFSSLEYLEVSIRANLDYSREVFKIPESQIKGITSLDIIIERLYESKSLDSLKSFSICDILESYKVLEDFIRVFSFYFNDFQDYIPNNFENLNKFLRELIEEKDFFMNRNNPQLLNDLTLIYFFINPYNPEIVSLAKKCNERSLEISLQNTEERLWSEFWIGFFTKIDGNIKFNSDKIESEKLYKKSILICEGVLAHIENIKDDYWFKNLSSRVYNTLAECYQKLNSIHGNKDEFITRTLEYCELTLKYKNEIHDYTGMAMLHNVRASFYSNQKDGYQNAMEDLNKCLSLNEKLKNYKGLYYSYLSMDSLNKKFNINSSKFLDEAEKIKKINNFS